MTVGLSLGAPGIYPATAQAADPGVSPVRLDVAGFVGVSWRGPVDQPVSVTSWTDFVTTFGGTDDPTAGPSPGLLPYAVREFFTQGGGRAWVSRVAPAVPDMAATARFELPGLAAGLTAANEGRWGDRLQIELRYTASRSFRPPMPVSSGLLPGDLAVPDGLDLPVDSLLRARGPGLAPAGTLHRVTSVTWRTTSSGDRVRVAVLAPPADATTLTTVAVVQGILLVTDRDPSFARAERIDGLGLFPDHPRFPARVLDDVSRLVQIGDGWAGPIPPSDGLLASVTARLVHGGLDRFSEIGRRSFFDDEPADADPLDERDDHRGVDRLTRIDELALVCVPDLTWSWHEPDAAVDPVLPDTRTGRFRPCAPDPTPICYAKPAPGPGLDPHDADQLAEILERQQRLLDVATFRSRFVVLLDAPSRLSLDQLSQWRARFDSSYAAAYHPWLGVPGSSPGSPAVLVPPSAFAAGIIASREARFGVPWGPANEPAVSAVTAADVVTDAMHDELHRLGVNVFRAERDGFWLTAARTMSSDPGYRQLSVRRLITVISLTLERQGQWLVFEPNTPALRVKLFHTLSQFLAALFRQGAFAGRTEQESFFVRCDDELNPPIVQALGRLVAEVGVAPSSPLEYLVLQIQQDTNGGLTVVSGP